MQTFKQFFYEKVIIPDVSQFIKHLTSFGNEYLPRHYKYDDKHLLNLLNYSVKSDDVIFEKDGDDEVKIFGGDKIGVKSLHKIADKSTIYIDITSDFYNTIRSIDKFYMLIKFLKQHIGHEFIHRKQKINKALPPDDPKYFEQEHEIEAFAYNAANELLAKIKDKKTIIDLITNNFTDEKLLSNSYRYSLYMEKYIDNKKILNKFISKVIEYLKQL